ncbi:hypothetical protein Spla01_04314 [Streptomyces platensis]|uniref:Uncharacterized protein n=1 Tax=Streptomyces platensis TaxID=58346 RepID=A0ABX3XUZ5_STRPT|nr:hypothetical protein BG653_04135 [Streptomyces platensis]
MITALPGIGTGRYAKLYNEIKWDSRSGVRVAIVACTHVGSDWDGAGGRGPRSRTRP